MFLDSVLQIKSKPKQTGSFCLQFYYYAKILVYLCAYVCIYISCWLALHHCDKIPEVSSLQEKRFILAHGFREWLFCSESGLYCFEACAEAETTWQKSMAEKICLLCGSQETKSQEKS